MSAAIPSHLEPSDLGTKEYWEEAYTNELSNHASNPTDTGHVWFSESDAEGRVATFLGRLAEDSDEFIDDGGSGRDGSRPRLSLASTSFLDLGTGNGSMLRTLREDGWRGEMLGVDYSEASVQLARKVEMTAAATAAEEDGSENSNDESDVDDDVNATNDASQANSRAVTRFETWDLIHGEYEDWLWCRGGIGAGEHSPHTLSKSVASETSVAKDSRTTSASTALQPWDVVLDKGTFDAISLSGQTDRQGRRIVETYRDRIMPFMRRRTGLLVITSCNWTEEELVDWFVKPGKSRAIEKKEGRTGGEPQHGTEGLVLYSKVKYPSFMFGGKTGQAINTLCFRRT